MKNTVLDMDKYKDSPEGGVEDTRGGDILRFRGAELLNPALERPMVVLTLIWLSSCGRVSFCP